MQTPMRQYANPSQSGTVTQTKRRPDKMEPVIDRVMMIAERLVNAEKALQSYGKIIADQTKKITELEAQIEGLKLSHFKTEPKTETKATTKVATKPPARRKSSSTSTSSK